MKTTTSLPESGDTKITFAEHKEATAKDCESMAKILTGLAASVREGDLAAFEKFWIEGGTEEGDAKIGDIRERIVLRYVHRQAASMN